MPMFGDVGGPEQVLAAAVEGALDEAASDVEGLIGSHVRWLLALCRPGRRNSIPTWL
jgi:hypothetical protein